MFEILYSHVPPKIRPGEKNCVFILSLRRLGNLDYYYTMSFRINYDCGEIIYRIIIALFELSRVVLCKGHDTVRHGTARHYDGWASKQVEWSALIYACRVIGCYPERSEVSRFVIVNRAG